MPARGSFATASLIVCSLGGCAPPAAQDEAAYEAPTLREPLDLTVDALDVVHGALRVRATMVDGAADVSVRLGGDCAHLQVGGGTSTASTFAWRLADRDLAGAIGCGLEVHARLREAGRAVDKVAALGVGVEVTSAPSDDAEGGPQLQGVENSPVGVGIGFVSARRGARLFTGESILEAANPNPEDDDPTKDDTALFTVPLADFARSVLGGRPLYVDGWKFMTSLTVGGASLSTEETAPESTEETTSDDG